MTRASRVEFARVEAVCLVPRSLHGPAMVWSNSALGPQPVDALALTPSAGILCVPSARAGPCGVVEEQVALGASATPEPVGFERVDLLDEASGQRRGQRCVGPDQLPSRSRVGHEELTARVAAGGQCIDLGTIQRLAGEDRVGRVDRRPLKPAEVGQVRRGDGLVDHLRQLRGRNGGVRQDRLGVGGGHPGRPPWPPQVGQEDEQLWGRRISHPQLRRGCDVEARRPGGSRRGHSGAGRRAGEIRRHAPGSPTG